MPHPSFICFANTYNWRQILRIDDNDVKLTAKLTIDGNYVQLMANTSNWYKYLQLTVNTFNWWQILTIDGKYLLYNSWIIILHYVPEIEIHIKAWQHETKCINFTHLLFPPARQCMGGQLWFSAPTRIHTYIHVCFIYLGQSGLWMTELNKTSLLLLLLLLYVCSVLYISTVNTWFTIGL